MTCFIVNCYIQKRGMSRRLPLYLIKPWYFPMSFLRDIFKRIAGKEEAFPVNAVLIDVRNPSEHAGGIIEGSVPLPASMVLSSIEQLVPETETPIVIYCASGMRSARAKKGLYTLGYRHVVNGMSIGHVANKLGKSIVKPT